MSHLPPDDLARIADYVAGELSPHDMASTAQWVAENRERQVLVEYLRRSREAHLRRIASHTDEVRFLSRISTAIGSGQPTAVKNSKRPMRLVPVSYPLQRSAWIALAAVVVAVVAIVIGWRVVPGIHSHDVDAVSTYVTGNGERAKIMLSDGSVVALDVASRLEVPVDFARGHRTLRLNGEALFTVNHHGNAPFVVIAGPATAQVLGTSFAVRHYATDTAAMVAVRDGKVVVQSRVLTAGQQVVVNARGATNVQMADASLFSFASGVLTLNNVPLPQAIPELDRWYDADIRLGMPSLAARRMDGRLAAGSLTDLMALLQLTFDVRVVRDGRVLTIFPR